jgi:hypothetical protein
VNLEKCCDNAETVLGGERERKIEYYRAMVSAA